MIKEKPILFSAPMVRAILDDRKTQTRRVFGQALHCGEWAGVVHPDGTGDGFIPWWPGTVSAEKTAILYPDGGIQSPYGKPGGRMWVKETWASVWFSTDIETGYADEWDNLKPTPKSKEEAKERGGWPLMYRADSSFDEVDPYERGFKWLPSIFMPRWASRIDILIKDIRVERLQDISEEDAKEEGCGADEDPFWTPSYYDPDSGGDPSYRNSFEYLWDSINGKPHSTLGDISWAANPWVWVVEFERI